MATPIRTTSSPTINRSILRRLLGERPVAKGNRKSRVGQFETLEDRRLLVGTPPFQSDDGQGGFYPAIGLQSGYFVNSEALNYYAQQVQGPYGPDYGNPYAGSDYGRQSTNLNSLQPEGLSQPIVVTEVEPNNFSRTGQFINLDSFNPDANVAVINGTLGNGIGVSDVDYFTLNLHGGDILDLRINGSIFVLNEIALVDTNNNLVVAAFQPAFAYTSNPAISPLSQDGDTSYAYVIPADGQYQLRISTGIGQYQVRLQAFRNTIEQQPIGTVQELFLDFDGDFFDRSVYGGSVPLGSVVIPSLLSSLSPYGYTPADVNRLIDLVTANVAGKFGGIIPTTGTNGDFLNDSVPGNFALRVTNSRDHGERFGLPNVSRVIIGGNSNSFFSDPDPGILGIIGIAQQIDVGNFDRQDTATTFAENFPLIGLDRTGLIAPGASQLEFFGEILATVTAHEYGHILGLFHTNFFNNISNIMDPFIYLPNGNDGIFGTADDEDIGFLTDQYRLALPNFPTIPGEFLVGLENQAATVSHALGTGTRGGSVTGVVFNDINRNGSQQSGEFGIAGQTVFVDINGNSRLDAGEQRTVTGPDGSYTLGVAAGTYRIAVVPADNFSLTTGSKQVTVALDQVRRNVDFGEFLSGNRTITGFKWADLDGNGSREASEAGIGGVYIFADLDGDGRPDLAEPGAYTNIDGSYSLTVPSTGTFLVRELLLPGFNQTFPVGGVHYVDNSTPRPLRGLDFGNQPARDYGDLPIRYGTLAANGGTSHGILAGLTLGTAIDLDADGQPTDAADGDDLNFAAGQTTGTDDEDGVSIVGPLVIGTGNKLRITVTNTTGSTAYLQGWLDFNGDGDFTDSKERIIADSTTGSGTYTFTIPAKANIGDVYARFRLSKQRGVGPTGSTEAGEVEDYRFQVLSSLQLTSPDNYTVVRNSTRNALNVLANDQAIQLTGFTARISSVTQGSRGGTLTKNESTVFYTPPVGFVGTEIFRYTVALSNGAKATETVTVTTDFFFANPVAVDNTFDVSVNARDLQLDVLANDVEGQNGRLRIQAVGNASAGGNVRVSSNGQKLIYSPATSFEGTETFTYTVADSSGATSTARVVAEVLPGTRDNDDVEFTLQFRNAAGTIVSQVLQGESFFVDVFVDDIRTGITGNPGVFAAYLDLLYNRKLVLPSPATGAGAFDFNVRYYSPYTASQTGSADVPGIVDELGAFSGSSVNQANKTRFVTLKFDALAAGIATFVPDQADRSPQSDVILGNNPNTAVPKARIRYIRSPLVILANPAEFPQAVDDSPTRNFAVNSTGNTIDVLNNDVIGANGPLRILSVTQPGNGSVTIDRKGNSDPSDDVLQFNAAGTRATETFTYTIVDALGFQSTGNVTVQVGNVATDDLINLRLEVTDLAGDPITRIGVNQQFQIRGYVDDLRASGNDLGVFAAFQDILFSDATLATVNAAGNPRGFAVTFSPEYTVSSSGDIRVPGLINEIGAQQTNQSISLGATERLQFIVTLTAKAVGTLTLTGDPADLPQLSDTLLFNTVAPVDPARIRYNDATISIVLAGGVAGAGEGFTNRVNRNDVNNDGYVSAIDVLGIINAINARQSGPLARTGLTGEGEQSAALKLYVDTNADDYLTALDVLQVINYINARSRRPQRNLVAEGEAPVPRSTTTSFSNSVSSNSLSSAIDAIAIDVEAVKKAGTRA